jgi:hypothetical protein
VIVKDGTVKVEANNWRVIVDAGWQTWVYEGHTPEDPVPATRDEVGDLFPPLEELVNEEFEDGYLLEPGVEEESLRLSIEQSTDQVYAGECGEPQTLEIYANLSGSSEAISNVGLATLKFQWEGIDVQTVEMDRFDDYLFFMIIGPDEYCCSQTTIVYEVEVFDHSGELLTNKTGEVLLEYCEEDVENEKPAIPEPISLSLELSSDKVYAGKCGEPQTLEIYANLSGSREALANIGWAILSYKWEGIEERSVEMKRIDEYLFFMMVDPYEYCCYQTPIVYKVEVFDHSGELLTNKSGEATLEYCEEVVGTEEVTITEPISLSLELSADKVYAGECGEPQTLEIYANLSGSSEAISNVGWATLKYQWEEIDVQTVEMERVDDYLFFMKIDPDEYCCYQTIIVYKVEVFNHYGELLTSKSGEVPLEYCYGVR